MNHHRILSQVALVTGTLLLSLGIQTYAQTWSAPTASPPNSNAYAPLNTGPSSQIKTGGLLLNTGNAINGLIVQNGNVGIGTQSPNGKLDVMRTISGLTTGLSFTSWHTPGVTAGGIINSNDDDGTVRSLVLQNNGGNVGIGTTNPTQKLDVAGYVKGTGLCIGNDCKTVWPSAVNTTIDVYSCPTQAWISIAIGGTCPTPCTGQLTQSPICGYRGASFSNCSFASCPLVGKLVSS